MKLLGVVKSLERANRNVASTLGFLAHHLNNRGLVSEIVEATLPEAYAKFFLLRNFSTDKDVWSVKGALDVGARKARTNYLSSKLKEVDYPIDLVLQIGSEFSVPATKVCSDTPVFSYHDDNVYRYFYSRVSLMDPSVEKKLVKKFQQTVQYEKSVYDGLTGVLCMTEHLKSVFVEKFGLDEEKVISIGFGANVDVPPLESIRRDYSKPRIMFIAKDSFSQKGGRVLLDAFKDVKKKFKDAELVIVGRKLDIVMDGVQWTGYLDKRNEEQRKYFEDIFRRSSLFVMPSFVEAAGGSFLEAMSYGLPCIGANQGSTPEIIVGHDAGLVLDKPDPKELADKIIALFEAPVELERMGANARKAVDEYYNWDAVCDRAEAIFRAALQ